MVKQNVLPWYCQVLLPATVSVDVLWYFFLLSLPPGQGFQGIAGDRGPDGAKGPPVCFSYQTHVAPPKKTPTKLLTLCSGKEFSDTFKILQGLKCLQKKMFFFVVCFQKLRLKKNSCSGPWTSFKDHFLWKNTQCWPGWNSVCVGCGLNETALWDWRVVQNAYCEKFRTFFPPNGSWIYCSSQIKSSAWLQSVEKNPGDITGCIGADSQDSRNFIVVPEFNSTHNPMVLTAVLCLCVFQPGRV